MQIILMPLKLKTYYVVDYLLLKKFNLGSVYFLSIQIIIFRYFKGDIVIAITASNE